RRLITGRLRQVVPELVDLLLGVKGDRQRLAHRWIGEGLVAGRPARRLKTTNIEIPRLETGADDAGDQVVAINAGQPVVRSDREEVGGIYLPLMHSVDFRLRIGEDLEDDLVQVRALRHEVIGVLHDGDVVAPDAGAELERTVGDGRLEALIALDQA